MWGGITGGEIAKYLGQGAKLSDVPEAAAREEEKRIFDGLLTADRNGETRPTSAANCAP